MVLELLVLVVIVVVQQGVILGLVNRLLIAKGVSPLRLPSVPKLWQHDTVEQPVAEGKKIKPIMTIPLNL